jgi:ComF family protein
MPALAAFLQQVGQGLLNLVFPPQCAVCRTPGALLCGRCVQQFPRVIAPICERCGCPTDHPGLCYACRRSPLSIDGVRSVVVHADGARQAIHRFKYEGASALAAPLADLMADYWSRDPLPADVWVAVPLHIARERERGYNQSYLLGREFGRRVGLPPLRGTLKRARRTRPQVGLTAGERRVNVEGAFTYCPPRQGDGVRGLRVLLVDDVCTTGATLEACSVALMAAGAVSVWGFTLARAAYLSETRSTGC